ncbi:helix-turn-helix domain-containing protein [Kineococcus aurantiacus]|uniref:Transcriptional regulator with XRE-family HTH domain n=1 Tax=Kineococcus aurantiacus TaxID=37633 RepID=A0A7Y9DNN8_9ACTN|nr:transcriptional regulator with XRE-family HTH domain [Kineococcus aurantiacus]
MEKGAVATTVATNIRAVRERRGWSQQQLAGRLAELGRPLAASAIAKVENGDRRVDVDDFAAFAVALNVSPARLMVPDADDESELFAVTPACEVWAWSAWQWATGVEPLRTPAEARGETEIVRSRLDFDAERPVWWRALDREPLMQWFTSLQEQILSLTRVLWKNTVLPDHLVIRMESTSVKNRLKAAHRALAGLQEELVRLTERES